MDEIMTRALLKRSLADAPPPAPVDLDRVIRLAAVARRRHTHLVLAAAAALVLVVTLAVTALSTGLTSDRAAPPSNRPPTGTTPRIGPNQFDPAHSGLRVQFPPGLIENGRGTTTQSMGAYAHDGRAGGSSEVSVQVGAKGVPLQDMRSFVHSKIVPGPTIHGHSTQWFSGGELGATTNILTWQWAPGAQARVVVSQVKDPLAVATKVALSVTIDTSSPARLPYTLKSPQGFTLTEFETDTRPEYSPGATAAYSGPMSSYISVTANLLGGGIGKPNTSYQGRPVQLSQEPGNKTTNVHVLIAAGDLKMRGLCAYHANSTITFANFKTLCLTTTASAKRVADLRKPATWPSFKG